MSVQIMVQNIPYGVNREDIIQLISKTINPENYYISTDNQGKTRGNAFIKYKTLDDAQKSIDKLNNILFHGNNLYANLVVNENNKYSTLQESSDKDTDDEENKKFKTVYNKMHEKIDKIFYEMLKNPKSVLNNPLYSILLDEEDRSIIRKSKNIQSIGYNKKDIGQVMDEITSSSKDTFNQNAKSNIDFESSKNHIKPTQILCDKSSHDVAVSKNSRSNIPNNEYQSSFDFVQKDEMTESDFTHSNSFICQSEPYKSSFMQEPPKSFYTSTQTYQCGFKQSSFTPESDFIDEQDIINGDSSPQSPQTSSRIEIKEPMVLNTQNIGNEFGNSSPQNNDSDDNDDFQNESKISQNDSFSPINSHVYSSNAAQNDHFAVNDDDDFESVENMQQNSGFNYNSGHQKNYHSGGGRNARSFNSGIDPEYLPSPGLDFTPQERNNQLIFQENVRIIQRGNYTDSSGIQHDISQKVIESISNTKTINKNFSYYQILGQQLKQVKKWGHREKKSIYSKIEITKESSFAAAKRIKKSIKEVCVLNFASATKPGGGVINGRTAQEESISRQSSLFFSLKDQNEMYDYHARHTSPFYSDYMIYSPNVVVFRDDNNNLCYPYRVSVISSPAVNCSKVSFRSRNEVYKTMKERCRKILQLGMATNNKAMILGAFGCGVFGNKPEDISKIFKELLIDEFYGMFFDKIVFAIKGKGHQKNPNFDAFTKTFQSRGWFRY